MPLLRRTLTGHRWVHTPRLMMRPRVERRFLDDFNRARLGGWYSPLSGTWTVVNNKLRQTSDPGEFWLLGPPRQYHNMRYRVTARVVSTTYTGWIMFLIHYVDANNYLFVEERGAGWGIDFRWWIMVDGTMYTLPGVNSDITVKTWGPYDFEVVVEHPTYTARMFLPDGTLKAETSTTETRLPYGRVGFGTRDTVAELDDFEVERLP